MVRVTGMFLVFVKLGLVVSLNEANSHRTDKRQQTLHRVLSDQCVTPVGVFWRLSELVFTD